MDRKYIVIIASLLILTLILGSYFIFFRKNLDESVETVPQSKNKIGDEVGEAKKNSANKSAYPPKILKQMSDTTLGDLIKFMKSLKQSGIIYKGRNDYEAKIISTAVVVYHCHNFFSNEDFASYIFNDRKRNDEVEPFKQIISDLFAFLSIRRKQGEQRDLIDSLAKKYESFIDFLPAKNTFYKKESSFDRLSSLLKKKYSDHSEHLRARETIRTDRNDTIEVDTIKVVLYNIRQGLMKYGTEGQ